MKFITTIIALFCIFTSVAQYKMSTREYIELYKDLAIEQMRQYKIPASITLAQGIIESGNGSSRLAIKANNHFGIKCKSSWTGGRIYHDDDEKGECFRKYPSARDSYSDHSIFLTTGSRYASLFDLKLTDYKGWAHGLKAAGYATNPQYAHILIKVIDDNELYRYDNVKQSGKQEVLLNEGIAPQKDKTGRLWGKNNGVKYVIANQGDTFQSIASQEGIRLELLLRYNDLAQVIPLKAGGAVYVESKRNKSSLAKRHVIAPGETIHSISQKYAVTIESLKSMNPKLRRKVPYVGQRIKLSK